MYEKIMPLIIILALLLTLFACASTNGNESIDTSHNRSRLAAEAALANMEGRQPDSQISPAHDQVQQRVANLGKPAWVESPEMVFSRTKYVYAVGHGERRDVAEKHALSNLTAFFGQSVHVDQSVVNSYIETVRSGNISTWTDNVAINSSVRTMSSMDALIGAEIREIWHDTNANIFYAIAIMDRERTAKIYSDLILANQEMINNLTNIQQSERNTLVAFTRYQFAAVIADMNNTFGDLLRVLSVNPPIELVSGNMYRLEQQNIANSIHIAVRVDNDRAGRIASTFTAILSSFGFRVRENNPQYICDIRVALSYPTFLNVDLEHARIELVANLIDARTAGVLMSWNHGRRDAAASVSQAEHLAYLRVETDINTLFKKTLSEYLDGLMPLR
jgi:hypothetical protein